MSTSTQVRSESGSQPKTWHIGQWGLWGWAETIVKIAGVIAALVALSGPFRASEITIGGNPELGALIILALLTLPTLPLIAIRVGQREIISIIFAFFNAAGHVAALIALARVPFDQAATMVLAFGALYVAGNVLKVVFLRATGYTEGGAKPGQMFGVSALLTLFYVAFVIALVI